MEMFTLKVSRPEPAIVRVTCTGDLDVYYSLQFRAATIEALSEYTPEIMELDFGDLEFIDGTGLGVIMGAFYRGESIDCQVRISRSSESVQRIWRLANLPEHNDAPAHISAGMPSWPEGTDRAKVGELPIKATLAHTDREIDLMYRGIRDGNTHEAFRAAAWFRQLAGALSLDDPAAQSPGLRTAISQAAQLSVANVAVATGRDASVDFDYLDSWESMGAHLEGDTTQYVTLAEWLMAAELALITGNSWAIDVVADAFESVKVPADAGAALTYARALAAWIDGVDRDDVPITSGQYAAELAMISAARADDPLAFDAALADAVNWHRGDVAAREAVSTRSARISSEGIEVTSSADLLAYSPLALAAFALRRNPDWRLTIEADYLPPGLLNW